MPPARRGEHAVGERRLDGAPWFRHMLEVGEPAMPDQRLHVADQMITPVGYEVSRLPHAEQYTTNSPTPPLLLHQWGQPLPSPLRRCIT